jgi:hypothetical protein
LAGCFRGSIYSSSVTIKDYLKDSRVKYRQAKVRQINKKNQFLEIETDSGQKQGGFSKVFLGAGCPHSTEIVMRSLGLRDKLIMADNAVYVFPIFYLGRKPLQARNKSYLALCNLIFGCLPQKTNEHFAQVQVYPNFDYLWRYNIPSKILPMIRPLLLSFRSRIFWARLYLHSDFSQAYSLELNNDQLVMDQVRRAQAGRHVKRLISSLRAAVNHQGFYLPLIPPIRQRVNSHYVGTMPFGSEKLKVSSQGEVMSNLYLSDSSCFPDSPAINPGFTIMANAWRIVEEVL